MLTTRKDLNQRIDTLEAEIATHDEAIEAANTARTEAEAVTQTAVADLDEATATITTLNESREADEATIAELTATLAERDATIAAFPDEDERIAAEAATQIAAVGHEAIEEVADPAKTKMSREEFDAAYNAQPEGKARSQWYLANIDKLAE